MPRYKLLSGTFINADRVYHRGDVIESAGDLLIHNTPLTRRFELIPDAPAATPPSEKVETSQPLSPEEMFQKVTGRENLGIAAETADDGLDDMTVAELKAYAKDTGIDLPPTGLKSKDDILKVIRAAVA